MNRLGHFNVSLLGIVLAALFTFLPAEAASIMGVANFDGPQPKLKKIKMASDPFCLTQHAKAPLSEAAVINPNGTLKNVFVRVKEGEELDYLIEEGIEPPAEPVILNQKGCRYEPHVFGIMVGQKLRIINSDNTLHNVHAMPKKGAFNLGMPGKPEPWHLEKSFREAETMVKIKCDVHSWMNAYVGVLAHPFYSVTDNTGSFEIKDLPPGEYVIEAWHEKLGAQEQTVTIDDGAPANVTFLFTPPKKA